MGRGSARSHAWNHLADSGSARRRDVDRPGGMAGGPGARELPSLIPFAKTLGAQGLSLMLISIGEDRATVERAVRERGYDVPVLLDPDSQSVRVFGVRAPPTVALLGRRGALLGTAIGPRPWSAGDGQTLLQALLACKLQS